MHLRHSLWLVGAVVLSACGPAGTLTGKVNVEGGSAAGVAVIVYGPQSGATVTKPDGAFSLGSLPDGDYVVRATVRGAEVEEQSATSTVTQGKGTEVVLNFKLASSKISGRVSFTDGSSAQNLTVTAVGPETQGARAAADGSYSFENLAAGAYLVSVEAPDTKEGRVSVGVFASGDAVAPELKLTPIGNVPGTVTYNSTPAAGVTVSVPGTSISTSTDAMGKFLLEGVPAGAQTVYARTGTSPFVRSATQMTTVARGTNAELAVMITDDPPPTGTLIGNVTFRGARTPRDITVTAVGSGVMGSPAANGTYSLTLPVGLWDIVATAPAHPPLTLGRVDITAGRTVTLPGQELSWFRPVWTSQTALNNVTAFGSTPGDATHTWSLLLLNDPQQRRLALTNAVTFEFRVLAVGTFTLGTISRAGKYAAWVVTNTAFVYEIATGALQAFNGVNAIADLQFSSDESVLFIHRAGPTLTRITLATPTSPTVFPATGNATQVVAQSPDRWFVRETTDVRLVTPTSSVAQVFTSVSTFSVIPTAWALTNCAATCSLKVLSPNATTAATDSAVAPAPGSVVPFGQSPYFGFTNRADHPCFIQSSMSAYCVRAVDGNHTSLQAVPTQFEHNEAGDRVVWAFTSGLNTAVREEAFPPMLTTTNLASSSNPWSVGWVSPNRAFAYETSGTNRVLHLVRMGVDAPDNDIGTQGLVEAPPILVVPQNSTSKWRALLGDGPLRTIEKDTTMTSPAAVGVRPLGSGPLTRFGGVAFDPGQFYLLDETAMSLKTVLGGMSTGAGRSGTVEILTLTRSGNANQAFYLPIQTAVLECDDVANPTLVGAFQTSIGAMGLGTDRLTVYGATFTP